MLFRVGSYTYQKNPEAIIFVILFQVVAFGWLAMAVSRIYQSELFGKFSVFAKDTVKMSETHADICKAFLVLYVIKVHIIPQFLYLIHTKCSGRCSKHEEEASDSKRETPEKTNKQSELSNEAEEKDYSDDQLPKYSSLSLA